MTGKKKSGLVGMFLHTFKDGEIIKQGQVVGLDGDMVLVQLFSWFAGDPTNVEGMPRAFIYSKDCVLYATQGDWLFAYETKYSRPTR